MCVGSHICEGSHVMSVSTACAHVLVEAWTEFLVER